MSTTGSESVSIDGFVLIERTGSHFREGQHPPTLRVQIKLGPGSFIAGGVSMLNGHPTRLELMRVVELLEHAKMLMVHRASDAEDRNLENSDEEPNVSGT